MLGVQVTEWGKAPKQVEVPEPPAPASDAEVQVRVAAAGLHQVVRSRASGTHYTSGAVPHNVGVDGVGTDVATGKKIYFASLGGGRGSFSQLVNVKRSDTTPLPEDVDPVMAAGLVNPVMSSWMALKKRVDFIKAGESREWNCMILGVTSVSGQMAIKVARQLGASKVFGAARNEAAMKDLGLDGYVVLTEPGKTDFSSVAESDVILDYLYGPWMPAFLGGTRTRRAVTYVQVGGIAGAVAELPSAVLRARDVTLRGAGPGSWDPRELGAEMAGMVGVLKGVRMGEVKTLPMGEIEEAWGRKESGRMVFVYEDQL